MPKILLIEDDHNLGLMVKDVLEFSEHTVHLLRNPSKAIEILLDDVYDLVILDKLLSGVDGTDICQNIRKTALIASIPILMMSALSESKAHCMEAGATDFIYKPFDIDEFVDQIKKTLK
ncbi:hypothetical protein LCGC14_2501770 [marine sediment metagenome]|uniref:Response regulatory domain-containing protein n=1 Tax=marine sediment metagenome TaxID=412755 RepID=A0A0F9B1N5_9ZZZZ